MDCMNRFNECKCLYIEIPDVPSMTRMLVNILQRLAQLHSDGQEIFKHFYLRKFFSKYF